jgi:IS605 OrfB family transposase
MRRACKVTLNFATERKRKAIRAFLEAYRAAVNFYVQSLWKDLGSLNKETYGRLNSSRSRLSARGRSAALHQALSIVILTKKAANVSGQRASCPVFKGAAILDAKFVVIENGRGIFDLIVKLSLLRKGRRVTVPTKRTEMLNKWTYKPLAKIVQGCALSDGWIVLWVELPDLPVKNKGKTLGIDIGMNKLISDSNGNNYGTEFKQIVAKLKRKKFKSKARSRVYTERDQFINRVVKQLPWDQLKHIGMEDLKYVKHGKKKNRGKAFRKAVAPWTYRRVLECVRHKAQENRVLLTLVDPAYTSRTCPDCGMESKENRKGENFECTVCHHKADADTVGALNVLARTLATIGSVESPVLTMAVK